MQSLAESAALGAVAGVGGTVPMTIFMREVAPRILPPDARPDEFIPKRILEWTEARLGLDPDRIPEREQLWASLGAHFTFGGAAGALYGMARREASGVPAPLLGALFGLAVWGVSYGGWLPALGIRIGTVEQPPKKWTVPIIMHLIYGVATALAYETLTDVDQERPGAPGTYEARRGRDASAKDADRAAAASR